MRRRFHRLLVAVDGSAGTSEQLRQAFQWARVEEALVEVCWFPRPRVDSDDVLLGELTRIVENTGDAPARTTLSIERSNDHDAVVDRALGRADLVVLSAVTDDRARVDRTIQTALRRGGLPVLLTKQSPGSRSVLAATDLSDPALPALESGHEVAKRRGWSLATLYCPSVLEPGAVVPVSPFDIGAPLSFMGAWSPAEALARAHERLRLQDASRLIGEPPAFESIVEHASALRSELLVIGRHPRPGWWRSISGGTSTAVFRRAPCSVLVVPLDQR